MAYADVSFGLFNNPWNINTLNETNLHFRDMSMMTAVPLGLNTRYISYTALTGAREIDRGASALHVCTFLIETLEIPRFEFR